MKKYALFLCAVLWAFGVSAVSTAQAAKAPSGGQASGTGTTGALGNAQAVDETALAIGDQGAAQVQPGADATGPSTIVSFLRMIFVLACVLGAIYLLFRLMKRAGRPKASSDQSVKVLAQASLGPGKAVHVIGIGDKAWLIGTSEASVSLIAELEDKELLDDLALKAATVSSQPKADFASILTGLLGRPKRSALSKKAGPDAFGPDYLAQQRERLKKL